MYKVDNLLAKYQDKIFENRTFQTNSSNIDPLLLLDPESLKVIF